MLTIKSKIYERDLLSKCKSSLADEVAEDLSKHPNWQIIQITESVIPNMHYIFDYDRWEGGIHQYTVFYREEE